MADAWGRGWLARCSLGSVGLVTSAEPEPVVYRPKGAVCPSCFGRRTVRDACGCGPGVSHVVDCGTRAVPRPCPSCTLDDYEHAMAWTGIHLTDKLASVGAPWSSRDPVWIGTPARLFDFAPPEDCQHLSGLNVGHRNLTYPERVEHMNAEIQRLSEFATLVCDLDRNANGRHEGDTDGGDPSGVSRGNPHVREGQVIGYSLSGQPIAMPPRQHRHKAEAWYGEREDANG